MKGDYKVRIVEDTGFWLALATFAGVLFAVVCVLAVYSRSHANDRNAVVCKLNQGVPLVDYYGDFQCVALVKP